MKEKIRNNGLVEFAAAVGEFTKEIILEPVRYSRDKIKEDGLIIGLGKSALTIGTIPILCFTSAYFIHSSLNFALIAGLGGYLITGVCLQMANIDSVAKNQKHI